MMDDTSDFAPSLRQEFSRFGYLYRRDAHILFAQPASLISLLSRLKDDWSFVMLLDICGVDNLNRPVQERGHSKRFECVYHLLNLSNEQRLRVRVPLNPEEQLPSAVKLWKGADWFEREVWDMFGIEFQGRAPKRLLTHQNFIGHPLRKDYTQQESPPAPASEKPKEKGVDIGLTNSALRGVLRVRLELSGEKVQKAQVEAGYLHRCFEKICEGMLYNQVIPYTDRLNYCSAAMNNIGWCKAVEDLMGLTIPDRAKGIRMVLAEFSRIADHLQCIGSMAQEAGAMVNERLSFELREKIYELFEQICGARITVSLTRVGGMAYDFPHRWVKNCLEMVKTIHKALKELQSDLTRNSIWLKRTRVCSVFVQDAIEWGYTGPCLRAGGVNHDLRKASPYYFYKEVDFEIPLGINGDCYDRYLVRVEEIHQSLRIISQVLDNLPGGAVLAEGHGPASTKGDGQKHAAWITEGVRPPPGEIYSATEAANGELGFFLVSDGSPRPYRVKVRPPCFPIFQSFSEVAQGAQLADASVALSSMNIVAGELDR